MYDFTTYLSDRAKAAAIAEINMGDDEDGWTYGVIEHGKFYVIEVRDDEGNLVGCL
jgi:hypothetical protein